MLYIYDCSEFDHTLGCSLTDYINSIEQLLLYFYYQNKTNLLYTQQPLNILLFSSISSFMGGFTHHYFTNNKHQLFFTLFWQISVFFQVLTSVSFLQIIKIWEKLEIDFFMPLSITIMSFCMMKQKFSFEIQMIFAAVFLIIFTVIAAIHKFYMVVFGCFVVFGGISAILTKMKACGLNHNSIFHVFLFFGFYFIMEGTVRSIESV